MEMVIPATVPVTIGAIFAFLTLFASVIGIYYRLSGQVAAITRKIDLMERRNERADHETELVKGEQAQQRTTVAVMAEQMRNQSLSLERIETTLGRLADRLERHAP